MSLSTQPEGGALDAPERLVAALEAASSPREVRLIFERSEALIEVAKRARVAESDLRGYLVASLLAQRRGGEMLAAIPRARSGAHVGRLPTIEEILGLPLHIARHIADNWRTVAAVPEHLFTEYVTRETGPLPSRAGLVRYHQPRRKHPTPPPDRLRVVPEPQPDPNRALKAEAWLECVEWFARQMGTWRVVDVCLQAAADANPYADRASSEAEGGR